MIARLILSLTLSVIFCTGFAEDRSFPFFQGSLQEIQHQAQTLNKPYFVYFYSRHFQEACDRMDMSWQHPELLFFVDRNYLALPIDVSLNTHPLQEKYEFEQFPAFLIFDPEGGLIGLHEGYISGQELLDVLEGLYYQLGDPLRTVYISRPDPVEAMPPLFAAMRSRGEPEPNEEEESLHEPLIQDLALVNPNSSEPRFILNLKVEGLEHYSPARLEQRYAPAYARYGLLINAYVHLAELRQDVQRFERIWKGDIWVYARYAANQWNYYLVLGTYEDKSLAETYAGNIEKFEQNRPKILNLTTIFE